MKKENNIKPPYARVRGEIKNLAPLDGSETVVVTRHNAATATSSKTFSAFDPSFKVGDLMNDIVTPGYNKYSSKGKLIVTPMRKEFADSEYSRSFSGASFLQEYVSGPLVDSDVLSTTTTTTMWCANPYNVNHFPIIPTPDIQVLVADAVNSAYASAHQRDVMGFVDLMEMGKTIDMLRTNLGRLESVIGLTCKPLKKLTRQVDKAGKKLPIYKYKAKTRLGIAADAASLHLEYQYGVKPLMMSLQGLLKQIDYSMTEASILRHTFRGSQSYHDTITETATNDSSVVNGSITRSYTTAKSIEMYARAGVITDYLPSLRSRLGLDGRDLVPGVYDLIPLSFVLDWFIDVNTYLEAVTPVKGFNAQASWVTTYIEELTQYRFNSPAYTTTRLEYSKLYRYTYPERETECFKLSRVRVRTPGVVPQLPHFDTKLRSLTHLISGAALAFSFATRSKSMKRLMTR
jgi:hypothetical protein